MGKKNKIKPVIQDEPRQFQSRENLEGFSLVIGDNSSSGDHRNIKVENFTISAYKKKLFDNISVNLSYGKHYGLIAPNGKGKSTLLNHIVKRILPINSDLDMLLVEQEAKASDKSILQYVLDANEKKVTLQKQIEILEVQMEFSNDENILEEYNNLKAANSQFKMLPPNIWSQVGPSNVPLESSGRKRGIGRLNTIAFHPTDANIIYVGAPAGGFWKSVNAGQTWQTSTDFLTNLGVSDIAINPSNPNEIFIITGDRDAGDTYSYGLMKSSDGGLTFNPT